jgi:hypothetical protein
MSYAFSTREQAVSPRGAPGVVVTAASSTTSQFLTDNSTITTPTTFTYTYSDDDENLARYRSLRSVAKGRPDRVRPPTPRELGRM